MLTVTEGELAELFEDFNEGRIQFGFVKVKDPNSGLPKFILIAWCGGGVPERTKGYFTSHLAAVSKVLHGYHVQITARSDSDLEPDSVMQKVADASGAKYSSSSSGGAAASAPPPVKSKPVFTPTSSSTARNPLVTARSQRGNVDEDGWGADAPPVTRSQIEKVESAYKPTKVNMAELTKQKDETTRFTPSSRQDDGPGDVVKGGYQPIGKVDIAAIRAQAQKSGDDRPTIVKGAYEPIGKVDIAAIRAKAQKPAATEESSEESKPLSDRAAAFSQPSQSERLTSLPKPKVANKFGGASTFTGTKAPTPGGLGFGGPSTPSAAPVGAASRTFADQGGKTPAQLWAEKKAKERGGDVGSVATPSPAAPLSEQKSGNEWKSGYSGKSWAPVQTSGNFGRPAPGAAGHDEEHAEEDSQEASATGSGGVSALKDRFKDTTPIGAAPPQPASRGFNDEPSPPPPVPDSSRPSGGFALPGLPSRPVPADEEEEPEDPSAYEPEPQQREESPVRVAIPVARGPEPTLTKPDDEPAPPPVPASQIEVPKEADLPDEEEATNLARGAAGAVAEQNFEPEQVAAGAAGLGGKRALIQYDYEKAEDNEIELVEGQYVTNIEMVDEDWWMGTNSKGEVGLFPSNYVELVDDDEDDDRGAAPAPPPPAPVAQRSPSPEPVPAPAAKPAAPAAATAGPTATALYDYEAAEDNGKYKPENRT